MWQEKKNKIIVVVSFINIVKHWTTININAQLTYPFHIDVHVTSVHGQESVVKCAYRLHQIH